MKTRSFSSVSTLAMLLLSSQFAPLLVAQSAPSVPGPAPVTAPVNQAAPVQLSSDVWDVVRLVHGGVGDDTVTSFIKKSGKTYALGVSEILYLRDQGVSDSVLTAMLVQRSNVSGAASPAPQPATASAASVWANSASPPAAPVVSQPAPNYVEAAPVYTQPSPVYVYPPGYSYYYGYPYYSSYWSYPSVSLSFGYWGGHYGGYHGGYYGGGYHSGGGHYGGSYGGGSHSGYSGGGHSGGGGHR